MKSRRLMPSPSIWPRAGIMAQQRPYSMTLDERRLATHKRPWYASSVQNSRKTLQANPLKNEGFSEGQGPTQTINKQFSRMAFDSAHIRRAPSKPHVFDDGTVDRIEPACLMPVPARPA